MKYLVLFCLVITPALAKDKLDDFNKQLMENFDKDIRSDNDTKVKRDRVPSRGPASVAPESVQIEDQKKIDKTVRQTGHTDW